MRPNSVQGQCPRCGTAVVIPLAYPYATEENPNDDRFTIPNWRGCPRQFEPDHGSVTDTEWEAVARSGRAV